LSDGLTIAREALAGQSAWLVGGAVRDRLLGRSLTDFDLVIDGDPEQAARTLARVARHAACFALSQDFGAWRVVARNGSWQADIERLRGASLQEDLALRDFTVNAIAEPIGGGSQIDPLGGIGDLRARRLRMAGPSSFDDDPLRVMRLVRMVVELDLQPEPQTLQAAHARASDLSEVSPERVFLELKRIIATERARAGIELMGEIGATAMVLPELAALRGVRQNRFHHLDVYDHTLQTLDEAIALQADPAAILGSEHAQALSELMAESLADGVTRGQALRWGALLHDAAKPLTRGSAPDGRVTFIGHDTRGAQLAHEVLTRLRASTRLRTHVAALAQHHLRLGFLVHEPQPLARRTVYDYLRATEPVEVDVTLLSVADRLATRGDGAERAVDAHLRVAGAMLTDALRWHAEGPAKPLLRGDELLAELDVPAGPMVGDLLADVAAAQYAGEVTTREQALAYARARHMQQRDRSQ
jgi:putative nucleotidyltransferase with HDIG domain